MADPRHGSYWDLVQNHKQELDNLLQQGVYKPIFLHHVLLFNCLPLIGLVIPRHRATRHARHLVFALSLGVAFEVLRKHRTLLGGNGYMIGLMTAWWLLWSAALFVFSDVEHDFRRIERGTTGDTAPSTATECSSLVNNFEGILAKTDIDGQQRCSPGAKDSSANQATTTPSAEKHDSFHWQSYPRKFSHRLEWCAGLLLNLRGPEWNWRVPHLGPLPRSVHAQLHSGFSDKSPATDDATYITAKKRLRAAFYTCLQSYLLLDVLKCVMMRDPYFQGIATADSTPPFPLSHFTSFPLLIRFYHCFLSCMGVYVALNSITSFNPICFLGLSLAFPNASRKLTSAPLDEPWLYADTFGPFMASVLEHGLAGCWGRWWHQLFRNGFTVTARWILSFLPASWAASSSVKRITHIVVAFVLSGFVHACGSHTQFADTHPFSGPLLFFSLQSVAIIVENVFKTVIFPRLPLDETPQWLRRTANAVFVFSWLLFSGAFIADDFARGGLWLMEPVPISPLRGLGIANGEGWWCWNGPWFEYWSDGTYWGSGIRVI